MRKGYCMVNGFVVKANSITGDKTVDDSITGFHYNGVDVICIKDENENIEINTIEMVKQILDVSEDINNETLKDCFVDYKNGIVPENKEP